MSTGTDRQKTYRRRMEAEGFQQIAGWVHSHQVADLLNLIRALKTNPDLEIGTARDARTGRLVKVR